VGGIIMTIDEFFQDFTQDVLARSGAEENFTRSIYLDQMCTVLENEGIITGYDLTEHKISQAGMRSQAVDAWSFDEERSCINLILADFRVSDSLESLTNTDIVKSFKRLRTFVTSAMNPEFATSLEETEPVAGLAWLMRESRLEIEKINLILVSNTLMSSRVAAFPDESACDYPTTYDVWDFERLYRNETSGKSREEVEITFDHLESGGLPCLPAYTGANSLKSYLLVMPGEILANLYNEHGERLFEQNVRTFLQFRGKVNKGIRNTIVNEPDMFFSYNNGLSATAETVETNSDNSRILRLSNLQIVNGGQTTASIFTTRKKEKVGLEKIYVQIKLSVIEPEHVEEIVPRISEYSNTQNKVNAADFFSNHPFHMRIEEFSRRLWAPAQDGSIQQTHWFYERARGQFANQQANLTPAQKKKFLSQNPRKQMFTKTDLAKFILSFDEAPHEVSLGAQKAFSGTPRTKGLVGRISSKWEGGHDNDFNEVWFKRAIAKAVFFRQIDLMIFRSPWYSGYKANIVTYTLAKFANMIRKAGLEVDFLATWEKQSVPDELMNQLSVVAEKVNEVLCSPPEGITSNVSEWAKKDACWDEVRKLKIPLSESARNMLIGKEESREREKEGRRIQKIDNAIHAQTYVLEKGADYWKQLRDWNRMAKKLSPKEFSILNIACSIPRKYPSEKQAAVLMRAEHRALEEGFFIGRPNK